MKEAERRLGSKIPWIADSMDNAIKHALGDAPNSEFIVDSKGRIIRARAWSDPDELRSDLEELVGPVKEPTRIADLDMKTIPPPKPAARGVVTRIERPRSMQAIVVEPDVKASSQPFYAKLRAEVDDDLLRSGTGKLYLGFHLDPLYEVHWNNLAKPIRVEIEPPAGAKVDAETLTGPKVEEEADVDPREFLVEIESNKRSLELPFKLKVHYFACNDAQGWCKPVSQSYAIRFERDSDAGRPRSPRGGGRPGRRELAGPNRNRPDMRPGDRGRPPGGPPRGNAGGDVASGRIESIDVESRTVTIKDADGKEVDVRIHDRTTIALNAKRCELSEFRKGDKCRLRLTPTRRSDDPQFARTIMVRREK